MRARFRAQLEEFHKEAFSQYDNEALWDDGHHPEPMKGDRFFLLEKSEGDEYDGLIFYSEREEDCYWWDSSAREWQYLSDEDIPEELWKRSKSKTG